MKKTLILTALLSGVMTFGAVANPVLLSGDMHAVTTPVQKELGDSMMRMHDDMAKTLSEQNADIAFAEGIIAHHKGAVEMAQIELKYGSDPEMRKLAQDIIDAQGPEIKQMQDWLKNNKPAKK
ncbi:CopM family metallochaperone [Morganella morganii]|uniref:CopM family metallochaperone n=1 Tax=Morganella morganii TaxID=582 RepID=UPI00319F4C59